MQIIYKTDYYYYSFRLCFYKVWYCRERQKGTKGNGCKNRSIREEALLQEIAAARGLAEFDREVFDEQVERVLMTEGEILVNRKAINK